ncbi:MAG: hypothetical protein R3336_02010, partial [Phycisphaeraceae bacterium]|nr:hypothetical protein [Phycisphaeraceae bacterium]
TQHLNELAGLEAGSLLANAGTIRPHLTAESYPLWNEVKKICDASGRRADRLSAIINGLELQEAPVRYDTDIADHNYDALVHLLPIFIGEKQQLIDAYDEAIEALSEDEVVTMLTDFREAHVEEKRTLQEHLDTLAGSSPAA